MREFFLVLLFTIFGRFNSKAESRPVEFVKIPIGWDGHLQMRVGFRNQNLWRHYEPPMASNSNPTGQMHVPAPEAQMIEHPGPPDLENHSFSRASEASSEDSKESRVQLVESSSLDLEPKRELPSLEITQESVDDHYVQFIFYCNPNIPLSTDTTELRRGFRSPPKTDGKVFDTFALFGLIQRLEAKEIETWAQLVIELGVEPPDPTKNQSAQKVQQFAVRLKV